VSAALCIFVQSRKASITAESESAKTFADFHSLRHLFITSLERPGIKPKMAQTLDLNWV